MASHKGPDSFSEAAELATIRRIKSIKRQKAALIQNDLTPIPEFSSRIKL